MVQITNTKTVMMEQALVCAAKYRLLALAESNQLMVRLFEENALWLEGAAGRLKRADNALKGATLERRTYRASALGGAGAD